MIRCHLACMMGERKMRIADVARETGLSRATVTLLYKETAQKVDLEALDKLCELFNCGIGELVERTAPITNNKRSSLITRQGREA
ncbi:helix-turn-helix domain-containing protein [Terasakiella pusilla]|uniref:helix-turn-helix domain-containing protein n=1 Tax=Terasakiella pusilla TaxID=64973 RepID=UPI003AA89519